MRWMALAAAGLVSAPALAGGTVQGRVGFSGRAPAPAKLARKSDPFCATLGDAYDEALLPTKDGKALRNVLVRIKDAPPSGPPAAPVVVDQQGCAFVPRVQGAVEGQRIELRNADPTLHNVHAYAGQRTLFNIAQPPKAPPNGRVAAPGSDVIRLRCDAHPWMAASVVVSKSSLFAVTDAEGRFVILGVPPGTWVVEAWHEKLGTQTATVTVEEGKAAEPKLAFSAPK